MSRLIGFDLSSNPVGAFEAICNRGWILLGHPGVSDGGQTTIQLDETVAIPAWLQLGRVILIERPPLPPWVGVIDTPWKATLPVELTLYNAEYLFSLRAAERSTAVVGPLAATITELIQLANAQESLNILPGNAGNSQDQFSKAVEQSNIWEQMINVLQDSGYEMVLRPQRDLHNRLYLYADVGVGLGVNTGFLLDDGVQGNMRVIEATVNGQIINRVKGVSGQSTEEDQLESDVLEDQESQDLYRTRSEVVQFRNVTQSTVLEQYTQTYINAFSRPFLDLTVEADESTFIHLRPGNRLLLHTAHAYLPGGKVGWRGSVRILAMTYDEVRNAVRMTLRGIL